MKLTVSEHLAARLYSESKTNIALNEAIASVRTPANIIPIRLSSRLSKAVRAGVL
jgi:hypothetical protein